MSSIYTLTLTNYLLLRIVYLYSLTCSFSPAFLSFLSSLHRLLLFPIHSYSSYSTPYFTSLSYSCTPHILVPLIHTPIPCHSLIFVFVLFTLFLHPLHILKLLLFLFLSFILPFPHIPPPSFPLLTPSPPLG